MKHDSECLPGVSHLAVLNLFREPDGTVEITVAMADGAMIEYRAKQLGGQPISYVEMLIVEASERIVERQAKRLDAVKP